MKDEFQYEGTRIPVKFKYRRNSSGELSVVVLEKCPYGERYHSNCDAIDNHEVMLLGSDRCLNCKYYVGSIEASSFRTEGGWRKPRLDRMWVFCKHDKE